MNLYKNTVLYDMEVKYLNSVDSTQKYIKDYITMNGYKQLFCVVANNQTDGIGSRGNTWTGLEGNLFFSFAIKKYELPKDLLIQSASIYFSFLLKKILFNLGSKVWLKWPNDFYINDKKIGGTITSTSKDIIYCGIGLNLLEVNSQFGKLDIQVNKETLLNEYLKNIKSKNTWEDILKEYMVEFQLSKKYYATINGERVSLDKALLNSDGSININNKKVFSLR